MFLFLIFLIILVMLTLHSGVDSVKDMDIDIDVKKHQIVIIGGPIIHVPALELYLFSDATDC